MTREREREKEWMHACNGQMDYWMDGWMDVSICRKKKRISTTITTCQFLMRSSLFS